MERESTTVGLQIKCSVSRARAELSSARVLYHHPTMTAFEDIQAMASLLGALDPDDTEAAYAGSSLPTQTRNTSFAPSVAKDDGVAIPKVRAPGDGKAIWSEDELIDDFDDDDDTFGDGDGDGDAGGFLTPKYDFKLKQSVNTADAFLGMSHHKDPGSRSCEDLVLTISLPGTSSLAELDLDVTNQKVRLRSHVYKLSVYLPHRIDSTNGKAEWDAGKQTLRVTGRIVDEDYGG